MKEILEIVKARTSRLDLPFALATVVRVEGSSYRRPGARMLIGMNGRVAGSVSGGCLEKDVVSKALEVLVTRENRLLSYDTTDQDDMAFGTSLGCEGRIDVFIEALFPEEPWALKNILDRVLRKGEPCVIATVYSGSNRGHILTKQSVETDLALINSLSAEEITEFRSRMDDVSRNRKALSVRYGKSIDPVEMLIERIAPPVPLFIFGGGHDVPPLVRLAREIGYHVTVIDRRPEFVDPLRFPSADLVLQARPHEVLDRISLSDHAVVVIMNHHYETDRDLLAVLLPTTVAYVGMLGPKKRTLKVLAELKQDGIAFSAADLKKLHAPAGLDIGSENPEEIALSILAEIQATLSGRSAHSLRERQLPIHEPEGKGLPAGTAQKPCPTLA